MVAVPASEDGLAMQITTSEIGSAGVARYIALPAYIDTRIALDGAARAGSGA
jgi:hypothetical protein